MHIQFNTDKNIVGDTALAQQVETIVRDHLDRFNTQITRVDVYLSDENGDKKIGIDAKRCVLVVDIAGLQPISASNQSSTLDQAVAGAAKKMKRSITSTLGRLNKRT